MTSFAVYGLLFVVNLQDFGCCRRIESNKTFRISSRIRKSISIRNYEGGVLSPQGNLIQTTIAIELRKITYIKQKHNQIQLSLPVKSPDYGFRFKFDRAWQGPYRSNSIVICHSDALVTKNASKQKMHFELYSCQSWLLPNSTSQIYTYVWCYMTVIWQLSVL